MVDYNVKEFKVGDIVVHILAYGGRLTFYKVLKVNKETIHIGKGVGHIEDEIGEVGSVRLKGTNRKMKDFCIVTDLIKEIL